MKNTSILIAGVGGQGTLLASRVFGNYAMAENLDCKLSEVHGMAQRGGSVVTHVKMGEKIYSPVISEGSADVIIAFEILEAARYSHFLKDGGKIIVNNQKLMPMPVVTGKAVYPHDVIDSLKKAGKSVYLINAADIAEKAGNIKAVNIAMIGGATKLLGFDYDSMLQAVKASLPEKTHSINIAAYQEGYKSVNL